MGKNKARHGQVAERAVETRSSAYVTFPIAKANLKMYDSRPCYINSELWSSLTPRLKTLECKSQFDVEVRQWLRQHL